MQEFDRVARKAESKEKSREVVRLGLENYEAPIGFLTFFNTLALLVFVIEILIKKYNQR